MLGDYDPVSAPRARLLALGPAAMDVQRIARLPAEAATPDGGFDEQQLLGATAVAQDDRPGRQAVGVVES